MAAHKVYLDVCCLKRSFDDQSQLRIAVESAAMVSILVAAERGELELLRSAAHYAENAMDPDLERRAAVEAWLRAGPPPLPASDRVRLLFTVLRKAGLGQMDALHLAWAEELGAAVLLTVDDRFLARSVRILHTVSVRVANPVAYAEGLPK